MKKFLLILLLGVSLILPAIAEAVEAMVKAGLRAHPEQILLLSKNNKQFNKMRKKDAKSNNWHLFEFNQAFAMRMQDLFRMSS